MSTAIPPVSGRTPAAGPSTTDLRHDLDAAEFHALLTAARDEGPRASDVDTTGTDRDAAPTDPVPTYAFVPTPLPASRPAAGTIGAMLALSGGATAVASSGFSTIGSSVGLPSVSLSLSADADERRAALEPLFAAAGERYGLDPDLLAAVAWTESNFAPDAVSPAGAIGLMQIMPGTADGLGVDPSDPVQAVDGAARYLRQQLDTFGGDVGLALAAYNAGPGAVTRYGGIPPYAETQTYVQRVLARLDHLNGHAS